LPLGLCFALLFLGILAPLGIPLPWILILSMAATFSGFAFRSAAPIGDDPEPFSKGSCWILALSAIIAVYYLHASQMLVIPEDFWLTYPAQQSMMRGNIDSDPYYPELKMQGHLSSMMLFAALARMSGSDTMQARWITEIIMTISSMFLWAFSIRRAHGRALAGVLGTLFIFFGINSGSCAGLIDAGGEDILSYLMLGALLFLYSDMIYKTRRHQDIEMPQLAVSALALGACASISETNLILVLVCFGITCIPVGLRHKSMRRQLMKAACITAAISLAAACAQKGTISSLAAQTLRKTAPSVYAKFTEISPEPATFSGINKKYPRIIVKFPKEHFLKLRLGVNPYQRISSALSTAWFRRYRPRLDDGGLCSIFSPKVLVLHWLPTWLAPLTIIWAIYKKSPAGCTFGLFGACAYLIPGIFDFGEMHETEYMRWELAAGLAFAGLFGIVLADIWNMRDSLKSGRTVARTAVIAAVAVNFVGAQRLVNNTIIKMQKSQNARDLVLSAARFSTKRWILAHEEFGLNAGGIEAAKMLWNNNSSSRRCLFLNENDLALAAMAGLSGTFPCGCAPVPSWRPPGDRPGLPSEPLIAFRKNNNADALAGLNINWIVSSTPIKLTPGKLPVNETAAGNYYIYEIASNSCPSAPLDTAWESGEAPAIKAEPLDPELIPASGSAYSIKIKSSVPLSGWIAPILISQGTALNRITPVTSWINGQEAEAALVLPLEENDYTVRWAYSDNSQWQLLKGESEITSRLSQAIEENLRADSLSSGSGKGSELIVRNIGSRPFFTGGPLSLQWHIWSRDLHDYQKGGNKELIIEKPIMPGAAVQLPAIIPEGERADISAGANPGPQFPVSRFIP
ncbi:MAG: hypothetical protein K6G50_07100, partial [bacterium]|nr:hypothetical protein [bacterium]